MSIRDFLRGRGGKSFKAWEYGPFARALREPTTTIVITNDDGVHDVIVIDKATRRRVHLTREQKQAIAAGGSPLRRA